MSDVNDALSQKYDKLKSKLLWEMARMYAGISLLQNICQHQVQHVPSGFGIAFYL
jgi:hypothetical protein